MPTFPLPESYRTWLKDAAVRSAVDHILNSKKLEVPGDLKWDLLPDFHAAVLAAHQVRCDYAMALHGVWKEVWQAALENCDFTDSLKPLSLSEQQEHSGPYDTGSAWIGSTLERIYDKGEHRVGLGVFIEVEQARLTIWLLDGEANDLTTSLALGDDWNSALDEARFLYSREELAPVSDGCIPLDPLNRAAKRALQEIGRILGLPEQR